MDGEIRFAAVVVAAGRGVRFGSPKHDVDIEGLPMWEHSVHTLRAAGADPVVVVGDVPGGVEGGERRRDSVANGLEHVTESDWVLIHDAARPAVSPDLVRRIMETARSTTADGIVPGIAVTDTIKRVDGVRVVETPDRSTLRAVQTPQAFRTSVLARAHAADDADATDDAALVERIGGTVEIVEGDPDNIKVTYREDLDQVRRVIEGRRS